MTKRALSVVLLILALLPIIGYLRSETGFSYTFNDPRDLEGLPGYFDVQSLTISSDEAVTFKLTYYENVTLPLPFPYRYVISIYVDIDKNPDTGSTDFTTKGADYKILARISGAETITKVYKWQSGWVQIGKADCEISGPNIVISVTKDLLPLVRPDFRVKVSSILKITDNFISDMSEAWLWRNRRVEINGLPGNEWLGIEPFVNDTADMPPEVPGMFDYTRAYWINNASYLFIRLDVAGRPLDEVGLGARVTWSGGTLYVDSDLNESTGYPELGADYRVDFRVMVYNDGTVKRLAIANVTKWNNVVQDWEWESTKSYMFTYIPKFMVFEWAVPLRDLNLRQLALARILYINGEETSVEDNIPDNYYQGGWAEVTLVNPMVVQGLVMRGVLEPGEPPYVVGAKIYVVLLNGTIIAETETDEAGMFSITIDGFMPGTQFRFIACYKGWMNNSVVLEFMPGETLYLMYSYKPELYNFTLELIEGWNFISLPLMPENNSLAGIFGDANIDKVEYVATYYDGNWSVYVKGVDDPKTYNMTPCRGYFVMVTEAMNITISGTLRCSINYRTSCADIAPITPGLNTIGITGLTPLTVEEWLSELDKNVTWVYICGLVNGDWSCRMKGVGGALTTLEPGRGYWLYATEIGG